MTDAVERDWLGRRIVREPELQEIVRKHKLWLNGEAGGERANLARCVISRWTERANLTGANLTDARQREPEPEQFLLLGEMPESLSRFWRERLDAPPVLAGVEER